MSEQYSSHDPWLLCLNNHLKNERYAPGTAQNRIARASEFLAFLEQRHIAVSAVRPADVERHLQLALRRFRRRHGHPPVFPAWRTMRTSSISMLLRLVHGQWPPKPPAATLAEGFQLQICEQYVQWMSDLRGLAPATISYRGKEARRFLGWVGVRADLAGVAGLSVADVDRYLKDRASSLRRSSIKRIADRVRAFLRWLYESGQTNRDLSTSVIGPTLYALENIPSALSWQEVEKVLATARRDRTTQGIRDYAILMLLAQYGVRAGEIVALRLDDIDWRREVIRIQHTKTGVTSALPLLPKVGNAILHYLQTARPRTAFREIFIRSRAPYRPFLSGGSLYGLVRARVDAAGVVPVGKRGPHAFRHARAVSLLRAAVPLKEIGDVLGHRAPSSTMIYLKLATEDLRAIALEIPAEVEA